MISVFYRQLKAEKDVVDDLGPITCTSNQNDPRDECVIVVGELSTPRQSKYFSFTQFVIRITVTKNII